MTTRVPLYVDCPACYREKDTRVRVAIHLLEYHHWSYQRGMDWLRNIEEKDMESSLA